MVANIFGSIAVILKQFNLKYYELQEKLEKASSFMDSLDLPNDLRQRIRLFLIESKNTEDAQQELNSFLSMLSPSFRVEVIRLIVQDSMMKNPVFSNIKTLDSILNNLSLLLFTPEETIIKQGDEADKFYICVKGQCEVYVTDQLLSDEYVKDLKSSEYFGEIALLK